MHPEVYQMKKDNQYFLGRKARIDADADSGLVHHVQGTEVNVADVTEGAYLRYGGENVVCADGT